MDDTFEPGDLVRTRGFSHGTLRVLGVLPTTDIVCEWAAFPGVLLRRVVPPGELERHTGEIVVPQGIRAKTANRAA